MLPPSVILEPILWVELREEVRRWRRPTSGVSRSRLDPRTPSGACSAAAATTTSSWTGRCRTGVRARRSRRRRSFLPVSRACGVELLQVIAKDRGVPLASARVSITGEMDRGNPVRKDLALFNTVRLRFDLEGVTPADRARSSSKPSRGVDPSTERSRSRPPTSGSKSTPQTERKRRPLHSESTARVAQWSAREDGPGQPGSTLRSRRLRAPSSGRGARSLREVTERRSLAQCGSESADRDSRQGGRSRPHRRAGPRRWRISVTRVLSTLAMRSDVRGRSCGRSGW